MSDYTKATNFATKDTLTSGDPLKIVKGTEIDTEFTNIETAVNSKVDESSGAMTGGTINSTTIGATTPSTGAFTTLSASSTVSGAGFSAYLASPPAIGGTTPSTGAFTTLSSSGTATLSSTLSYGGVTLTNAVTGTGKMVLDTSPTLVTPVLGTPTSGVLTNCTGVQYNGFKNRIINGSMVVDQRNAGASQTFTAAAALAYTVDRWYGYCTGANVTGQQVAGSTTPTVTQNRYRFTGAASVTAVGFGQRIEQKNSYDLAGSTCTLSADLAISATLTTVTWTAYYATTTADTFGTLASPTVTQISTGTFTVSATVTNFTTNISIPAAATTGIQILFTVGALTAGLTWTIGNVQLEKGSTATSFDYRPYGTELMLCQRYYEKSYNIDVVPGTATSVSARLTTNIATITGGSADRNMLLGSAYAVTKRTTPAVVFYNVVAGTINAISSYSSGVSYAVSTYSSGGATSIAYYIGTATSPAGTEACSYQFTASAEL